MRALVLAVLLAACATPAPPPPYSPPPASLPPPRELSPFALRVSEDNSRLAIELGRPGIAAAGFGETADLGGGLPVRPLEMLEDSRCPQDVACVWAGRLRIRAMVSGVDAELTLGETYQTDRGAVVFALASPGAWSQWPSEELGPRPPYRFGFRRA